MDLEVTYACIFFLDRWCGSSWLSGLSPSEWGGVSLLVAFVLGVLVVAGDGLVVFLVAARGAPRRLGTLGGVSRCFAGPAFFAAFPELRGASQVERFAACSFDIRRK